MANIQSLWQTYLELFKTDNEFKCMFEEKVKLWKRFIADCGGIISGGINEFRRFF